MRFLLLALACLRACSSRFHFSRLTVALASVPLASLPLAIRASAAIEWAAPTGGYFDVGSNWVGGAYPNVTQVAAFYLPNSYTVQWNSLTATNAPGVGFVTIEDSDVVFQNAQPIAQWDFTVAGIAVFEGASLTIRGLHLRYNGNANYRGYLTIDGDNLAGSKITDTSAQGFRSGGDSVLQVKAGGVLTSTGGYLGHSTGAVTQYGAAIVTGLGSQWNNSATLQVGAQGRGYLGADAGGVVTNTDGYIGYDSGSSGDAQVSGSGSQWNNSGSLFVGHSGAGTMRVAAGGQVTNAFGFMGLNAGSTGGATVTGSGSEWKNTGSLRVGVLGVGMLSVEAGGLVTNGGNGSIGGAATGVATVTGSGSQWNMSGGLFVGNQSGGTGSLTIADNGFVSVAGTTKLWSVGTLNLNGGVLETGSFDNSQHGAFNLNNGKLTVNGVGGTFNPGAANYRINGSTAADLPTLAITNTASLTLSEFLVVGDTNKGNLTVSAGSVVSNTIGYLGNNAGSTGSATVNGTNSRWNNSQLLVGGAGNGTLNVEAGATVSNTDAFIGAHPGSSGVATVSGAGSQWASADALQVGFSGDGTLNVEAGAAVSNTAGYIGSQPGSSGAATVTGAGSQWNNSANLGIGLAGTGRLSVANGGMVTVGGLLTVGASGVLVGNGSIVGNVSSGGAVAPGNSAGLLTIEGNYTQTSGGTLYMELGGVTPEDSYDQLLATGQMALGGTLSVSSLNGFEPQSGDAFDILDWGSLDGTFAVLELPPLPDTLTWNTSNLYTSGVLSVASPSAYVGDNDGDIDVDGADFLSWQRGLSPNNGSAADLAAWRTNFGEVASTATSAAVPEPATLTLLIFAAAAIRRRRRNCVSEAKNSIVCDLRHQPTVFELAGKV